MLLTFNYFCIVLPGDDTSLFLAITKIVTLEYLACHNKQLKLFTILRAII